MSRIALFGATSEIGGEIAVRLATDDDGHGNSVVLAARRPEALADLRARLLAAGAAEVETVFFDAADCPAQEEVVDRIEAGGAVDTAVAAFGVLGDQEAAESDPAEVERILHTDFTAQAVLLTLLAARMRRRGRGTLVAFSSVAGARVRRPNYVYGSAKAGLDGFCQGMQDALAGTGVRLLLVRPGFVVGRMTAGMTPAPMSSTPAQVADATVRALGRPGGVRADAVWIPARLGVLAAVTHVVPRWLWRRAPR
ncbi:SDR family NAD(P)-dependent oxidoreductase [Corynebacterium bovis]|uniref:SDR family NAD(P)-dependent oxidoreductase n=1 Tax=Corynebacterium bovis TaxID=36808 RepID=UPI0024471030|nr:SDR family NAD(P)-dependent oxidoreductase [Corynebacterium bovis]MDH2454937.1 SDR family NAD(P)-dependent oxidoreductase [Corynebacterium bovis]